MEYVFTLPESCSVAWGTSGVWLSGGEAWFADDPFVKAHPDMFSVTPPRVRSTTGREVFQVPMSQETEPAVSPRRGRNG